MIKAAFCSEDQIKSLSPLYDTGFSLICDYTFTETAASTLDLW